MRNIVYTVASLAAVILAASPGAAAAKIGSGPGVTSEAAAAKAAAQAAADATIFIPVATVQSAGGSGIRTIPASTLTPVDSPKTVVCPGPGTCRIEAVVWASLLNGSTTGNSYGLCGFIDGQIMAQPNNATFGCPFTGQVPADGSVTGATQITAQSQVAPGSHTVQFEAFVVGGATIGLWVAEYHMYSAVKSGARPAP